MSDEKRPDLLNPQVVLVDSINMDLVSREPELVQPDETMTGDSIKTTAGRNKANQAVAAARLGANLTMIGRIELDRWIVGMRK